MEENRYMKKMLSNIILKIPRWYLSYIPFFPFSKEYRKYFNLLKKMDNLSDFEIKNIQEKK